MITSFLCNIDYISSATPVTTLFYHFIDRGRSAGRCRCDGRGASRRSRTAAKAGSAWIGDGYAFLSRSPENQVRMKHRRTASTELRFGDGSKFVYIEVSFCLFLR